MRFENKVERMGFDKWYNLASKYYEYYHDLEVPLKFKTINGYEEDENGYNLGVWIENQRRTYKKGTLTEEEVIALKEIGMRFENKILSFDKWYDLASKYYDYYHDLEVPKSFKTTNGYEKDENGYNLGKWIENQRMAYKKGTLTEEKVIALKEIGMRFENKILSFDKWYDLASKYYDYYHDLEVSYNFKTLNGCEADEDGYNLGFWISTQRKLYKNGKLDEDKIRMLEDIGMVWRVYNTDVLYESEEVKRKR